MERFQGNTRNLFKGTPVEGEDRIASCNGGGADDQIMS
jgi:hypothetical protein